MVATLEIWRVVGSAREIVRPHPRVVGFFRSPHWGRRVMMNGW